jgi:hypothetical protein
MEQCHNRTMSKWNNVKIEQCQKWNNVKMEQCQNRTMSKWNNVKIEQCQNGTMSKRNNVKMEQTKKKYRTPGSPLHQKQEISTTARCLEIAFFTFSHFMF